MRFIKLAHGNWTVLVYTELDSSGKDKCQTLDFLTNKKNKKLGKKMKAMLSGHVPINGPPKHNKNMSRPLRDEILEFKRGPKRGAEVRTLYFYGGGGSIVVCAGTFKKAENTDDEAIDRAKQLRDRYFKILNGEIDETIEIVNLDETDYEALYDEL